jgi:hypothetical protein
VNAHNRNEGKVVTAGFVLGLICIVGWFIPLVGFPVTIVGLIMSVRGKSKEPEKKGLAPAGLVLNIIFLVATIINSAIGAYIGATGGL